MAATAFHWFRGPEALAEIARVLRPGGGLGLLWNNPDRSVDWVARIWAVVDTHRGQVPGNRDLRWRDAFAGALTLGPVHQARFTHTVELDLHGLLARVDSITLHRCAVGVRAGRGLRLGAGHRGRHPGPGRRRGIPLPYVTDLYWCTRT